MANFLLLENGNRLGLEAGGALMLENQEETPPAEPSIDLGFPMIAAAIHRRRQILTQRRIEAIAIGFLTTQRRG